MPTQNKQTKKNQYWGEATAVTAWTRREFMSELVKAGWSRPVPSAAVYTHPDGGEINIDQYNRTADGVLWKQFAERHQLPDTSGNVPF